MVTGATATHVVRLDALPPPQWKTMRCHIFELKTGHDGKEGHAPLTRSTLAGSELLDRILAAAAEASEEAVLPSLDPVPPMKRADVYSLLLDLLDSGPRRFGSSLTVRKEAVLLRLSGVHLVLLRSLCLIIFDATSATTAAPDEATLHLPAAALLWSRLCAALPPVDDDAEPAKEPAAAAGPAHAVAPACAPSLSGSAAAASPPLLLSALQYAVDACIDAMHARKHQLLMDIDSLRACVESTRKRAPIAEVLVNEFHLRQGASSIVQDADDVLRVFSTLLTLCARFGDGVLDHRPAHVTSFGAPLPQYHQLTIQRRPKQRSRAQSVLFMRIGTDVEPGAGKWLRREQSSDAIIEAANSAAAEALLVLLEEAHLWMAGTRAELGESIASIGDTLHAAETHLAVKRNKLNKFRLFLLVAQAVMLYLTLNEYFHMNSGQQYVQPLHPIFSDDDPTNSSVPVRNEFSPLVMNINNFYISCAWWIGSSLVLYSLGVWYIAGVPI